MPKVKQRDGTRDYQLGKIKNVINSLWCCLVEGSFGIHNKTAIQKVNCLVCAMTVKFSSYLNFVFNA